MIVWRKRKVPSVGVSVASISMVNGSERRSRAVDVMGQVL